MANEVYIDGSTILISIKAAADADYKVVGCGTNSGDQINRTPIKILNKCNYPWPSQLPGEGSWQITQTGDAIVVDETATPAPSTESFQKLKGLSITGEVFAIKMASADGKFYLAGNCIISSFQETADMGKQLSYQVTFMGSDTPIVVAPTT